MGPYYYIDLPLDSRESNVVLSTVVVLPVKILSSADLFRPLLQPPVMLCRQNFRWRHQRGLITVFTGVDHCRHGNDCLSRTDISLEQTIHAPDGPPCLDLFPL